MSIEFLITSLVIIISPGTGALYTIATGLSRGLRPSVVAAFGCTLGIIPHLVAASAGLAAVMHTSSTLFDTFKYCGVAYLLWMAWSTLQEQGTLNVEEAGDDSEYSPMRIMVKAVLINFLNPKLSIFFLAFLPQFVPSGTDNTVPKMLELSLIFMAMTFVVFAAYGMFAAAVRDHVISRPRVLSWMRRTFAGAFVAIGIQLALADR
jgi:threonine/homoserine/homoserine lactone efflux protein